EHRHAVRVFKLNGEVIEDLAMPLAQPRLTAAKTRHSLDRVSARDPVHDVEVMHVLLDDMVARQPGEIVPVADLPFQIAPARLAVDDPDLATVPIGFGVGDITDRAIVDAL